MAKKIKYTIYLNSGVNYITTNKATVLKKIKELLAYMVLNTNKNWSIEIRRN